MLQVTRVGQVNREFLDSLDRAVILEFLGIVDGADFQDIVVGLDSQDKAVTVVSQELQVIQELIS